MKTTTRTAAMLLVAGSLAVGILVRNHPSGLVPAAQAAGVQPAAHSARHDTDDSSDSSLRACSLETIEGSYGTLITGSIVSAGPVGLVADVGVITFDGNGGASQTSTVSLNGMIIPKRTSLSGSYEVNSDDCTGSITLILPGPTGPITSTANIVIVNHGKELRIIVTGAGRVLAGTALRQ